MRAAALILDLPGLTRADYEHANAELVVMRRRPMPTLNQIEEVLHQNDLTWDAALDLAGLEPGEQSRIRGGAPPERVERFAAATGAVPSSRRQLERWVSMQHITFRKMPMTELDAAIAAFQSSREAQELRPLAPADPRMQFETTTRAGEESDRVPNGYWQEKPNVIAGLARAIAFLSPGESLGQRPLKRIAKANREHALPGGYAGPIPSWAPVVRSLRQAKYASDTLGDWLHEAEEMAANGTIPPWQEEIAKAKAPPAGLALSHRRPGRPSKSRATPTTSPGS